MTTTIIILLIGIAFYCFGNWLTIAYWTFTRQFLPTEFGDANTRAFESGLCGIIALGFAGLLLK